MTTGTLHPLAADYLARLRHAGRRLRRAERRELLAEIEGHICEATHPGMSDAQVLTVLDRLGEPEEIVAAQQPAPITNADARGIHEWSAIILLLLGGFIFGVGWLGGVILLWSSRAWTTRDKWIGTLVVPGGLASVYLGLAVNATSQTCVSTSAGGQQCTGGPSTAANILGFVILALLVLGPIATAVYLAQRAR